MISILPIAVKSGNGAEFARTDIIMNHSRILRTLNVLFLSCGYQVQWFSADARKLHLTLLGFVYFVCLLIWYAICFQQHFADSSIFFFLNEVAPVLHKCIRFHLLMGIKVMVFALFEMRYVMRALSTLVKALPKNTASCWSRNEFVAYIWLFSGLLINFGFAIYIMVQMDFLRPTLQQIMHFTAMFLPHFGLACSFKLLNITTWIVRTELRHVRTRMNEIFNKESYQNNISVIEGANNHVTSLELSEISKEPNCSERALLLAEQLEALANATQQMNDVLQKQMVLLFSMNSICLLGATYSIVYYKTTWQLILEGPLGNSLIAFNIGVIVFIFWDYFCLCVANFYLGVEKTTFVTEALQILKRKSTVTKDTKSILKNVRNLLEHKFDMRIFFTSPITWQTFLIVNALIGLSIAVFMMYHYFKDQIENLQMRLDGD